MYLFPPPQCEKLRCVAKSLSIARSGIAVRHVIAARHVPFQRFTSLTARTSSSSKSTIPPTSFLPLYNGRLHRYYSLYSAAPKPRLWNQPSLSQEGVQATTALGTICEERREWRLLQCRRGECRELYYHRPRQHGRRRRSGNQLSGWLAEGSSQDLRPSERDEVSARGIRGKFIWLGGMVWALTYVIVILCRGKCLAERAHHLPRSLSDDLAPHQVRRMGLPASWCHGRPTSLPFSLYQLPSALPSLPPASLPYRTRCFQHGRPVHRLSP